MATKQDRNLYRVESTTPQGVVKHAETKQRWESVALAKNLKKLGWAVNIQRYEDELGRWVNDEQGNEALGPKQKEAVQINPDVILRSQSIHTLAGSIKKNSRNGLSQNDAVRFLQETFELMFAVGLTTEDMRGMLDDIDEQNAANDSAQAEVETEE